VKEFSTENIRNIGLFGHGGVGKTSLAEAILFAAGMTNRLGKPDDGTTVSDYTEEEIGRKLSISSALLHAEWKNHKINVIDTPGYADFSGEVVSALRVVDLALVLISASSGIEVGTEQVYETISKQDGPRAFFVNKMEKEHADYQKCIDQLCETF
jgi:elongation factor G